MLSFIYQQSLESGQVPQDWRNVNVALILKRQQEVAANNCPVSLTAIPCKIPETDCQHGFRVNQSCETQLIITTHDLATALNWHRQVDMTILDFSKAFDKVLH